jgi:hypothetical protein
LQALSPADNRSKFIEALHHLLARCTAFYHQDDDTTVAPMPSPCCGLKEVHLLLAEGAQPVRRPALDRTWKCPAAVAPRPARKASS